MRSDPARLRHPLRRRGEVRQVRRCREPGGSSSRTGAGHLILPVWYDVQQEEEETVPPRPEENWYSEFKRLNASSTPAPSPPVSPASHPKADGRRIHTRFCLDEASVALSEGGLLAAFGVGRNLARSPVDLSEGGLRVLLQGRVKIGTKVKLRLEIARQGDAVDASGVVRWCFESGSKPGDFYAGIMFTDLGERERRKISRMRDWFTSAQFKALSAARKRQMGTLS